MHSELKIKRKWFSFFSPLISVISIINCIIEYPQERARLLVCDVQILEFSVPVCCNHWGSIGKNCAISSFLKIALFSGIKITMCMPWRRTAKQPPVWIRPFGVSTVADFLADLQAQKSHILYPLLLLVRAFFQANSKHLGTLLTTTIRSIPLCIVYQGRRVPAPLHIFFFSPAHHHRAVCPPPPPAAGSFAAHRRTPPFFKVSSAWNSDVKRNKKKVAITPSSYWRDRDLWFLWVTQQLTVIILRKGEQRSNKSLMLSAA